MLNNNRIGRKWTVVICHSIAAVALVVATVLTYSAGMSNRRLILKSDTFLGFKINGIKYNNVY